MPWSDDTRCLYCDGKLPLFRKLTHGQFCSKAHQKKYWDEQQRLAVERLHQTHSNMQAYRPPEPIENILGPLGPTPETDLSFLPLDGDTITGGFTEPANAPPSPASDPIIATPPVAEFLWESIDAAGGSLAPQVASGLLTCDPALEPCLPACASSGAVSARLRPPAMASLLANEAVPAGDSAVHRLETYGSATPVVIPVQTPRLAAAPTSGLRAAGQLFAVAAVSAALPAHERPLTGLPAAFAAAPALLPALAVPLSGSLCEVSPEYEPPRVERLCALAMQPCAGAGPCNIEIAPVSTAAAQPWMSLSSSVTVPQRRVAAAGLLPLAGAASGAAAEVRCEIRRVEQVRIEAVHPAVEQVAVPAHSLAPCALQRMELSPAAGSIKPAGAELRPSLAGYMEPTRPEPALAGAPLAPAAAKELAGLPWTAPDISGCPDWNPPLRAIAPELCAVLPLATPLNPLPVTIETPALGAPVAPVAAPFEIPPAAPRVAMTFAVVAANRKIGPLQSRNVIPEPVQAQHGIPMSRLQPIAVEFGAGSLFELEPSVLPGPLVEAAHPRGPLEGLRSFWAQAPRNLKILAFVIPLLIGLTFHSLPKVSVSANAEGLSEGIKQAWDTRIAHLRQTVANRAAIALDEDFRSGLDNWVSRTGATAEWSFNQTGFVQPGPLALYAPSLKLTDYQMHFLGMIDQKALSWVARAADFQNYYVVKLVVVKPGPLPLIGLTRYAVIDGKAMDRVDRPVPVSARPDTIYRVRMQVRGSDFALEVQGQMVDTWTEPRLKHGGIGFFTGNGEKSSIRWVQLTHQYDVLGRLCAYLAPYEF